MRSWRYWARLLAVGLLTLYPTLIFAYAWTASAMMTRPTQHVVCCQSPADFGADYESVSLTAPDGVRLAGWYIPSQNGAAVILLHGYGGDRLGTLEYARMLSARGYGALLYDQRASGESEGEMLSWGWRDVADVQAPLNFLLARDEVEPGRIGVMGCSTGAEVALNAAASFDEIGAVLADAPYYATAGDSWPPFGLTDTLGWPIYPLFIKLMEWRSGATAPMSLGEAVTKIAPRPLMLISAGLNEYEQFRARRYFELAGEPKEYWVVEEAEHCGGVFSQPEAYQSRMVEFFDRALLEP